MPCIVGAFLNQSKSMWSLFSTNESDRVLTDAYRELRNEPYITTNTAGLDERVMGYSGGSADGIWQILAWS